MNNTPTPPYHPSSSSSPNGVATIPFLSPKEAMDSSTFYSEENYRGIYILYEDVKSCPYEDVHVLWSILVETRSHPPALPPPK
ncbi:hypothetical protein CASFOL_029830 [Castilleja foliolosa]|uniref:Uncharacterized protein n=1 Tax=Castilleja foliolosa TaxID=1961234 RepID=A0ABD3CAD8_9LAMI